MQSDRRLRDREVGRVAYRHAGTTSCRVSFLLSFADRKVLVVTSCSYFLFPSSLPVDGVHVLLVPVPWKVCRAGRHSHSNFVHLRQSKMRTANSGGEFAWLTTDEPATQRTTPRPNFDAEGRTGCGSWGGETSICMDSYASTRLDKDSSRGLSLSFGSLDDSKPRGRCRKKPLSWTPTHLVYVPVTRSIVVACYSSSGHGTNNANMDNKNTSDTDAISSSLCGTDQETCSSPYATRLSSSSSLRIFDADTLEERSGGSPLRLLPGVRVTGIALLASPGGDGALQKLPVGSTATAAQAVPQIDGYDRRLPLESDGAASAAVGGDVVAVACCSCASTTTETGRKEGYDGGVVSEEFKELEQPGMGSHEASGSGGPKYCGTSSTAADGNMTVPSPSPSKTLVTTVLAAFEVVACGYDGVAVKGDGGITATGELPHGIMDGVDSDGAKRPSVGCDGDGDSEGEGGIILAALAASPEMAGAWFGLEALGKRFVAASTDDKVVVFGWKGSQEGGLR